MNLREFRREDVATFGAVGTAFLYTFIGVMLLIAAGGLLAVLWMTWPLGPLVVGAFVTAWYYVWRWVRE